MPFVWLLAFCHTEVVASVAARGAIVRGRQINRERLSEALLRDPDLGRHVLASNEYGRFSPPDGTNGLPAALPFWEPDAAGSEGPALAAGATGRSTALGGLW